MQTVQHLRAPSPLALVVAVVAGVAAPAGPAHAYAEFGYFSGAYATPGEGGCWGSDAQGVDPYGGCASGAYPLSFATASVYGVRGRNNFATATADIAGGRLYGSSYFPGGSSNSPGAVSNFMDRLTVTGPLPNPVDIVVTLTIDSNIRGDADSDNNAGTPLNVWLLDGGGLKASFVRSVWSGGCFWPRFGGALCDEGYGHTVRTISTTETVSDGNRSFWVGGRLSVGDNYQLVDAIATFSIALPAGVSITSASGVFPTTPVPEAAAATLLLSGLAALGLLARGRRAA